MARSEGTTESGSAGGVVVEEETSLEAFVAQLHAEGVESGRKQAAELVQAAEAEAEEILRRARADAEIVAERAVREAEEAGARGRAELELAVRDAILQLQAALSVVLRSLIERSVEAHLADPESLKPLLREVVKAYARADASAEPTEFRVPPRALKALESWWIQELGSTVAANDGGPTLVGGLGDAGFEYHVGGATVEVSVESVVEKLMELVRPGLREVVEGVAKEASAAAVAGAEAS